MILPLGNNLHNSKFLSHLQNSYQYSHHHHHHQQQHHPHQDGKVVKLEPEGGEFSFHATSGPPPSQPPPPPPPPGPNAPDLPHGAIVAAIRQSAAAAAGRRPMMHPVDMDANEILKVI